MKTILKLGALLGKRDPRNLHMGNYIDKSRLTLPSSRIVDWDSDVLSSYQMFGNDKAGDCVIAAKGNFVVGAAAKTGDACHITTEDVLNHYSKITNYDPVTGRNDNGTNPEDALRYFSKLPEGDPFRVIAWGEVNFTDLEEMLAVNYIFGGVYTAYYLPTNSISQFQNNEPWHVNYLPWHESLKGSAGGHMVMTRFVNLSGPKADIRTITWAKQQAMSEEWHRKYCAVAYFMINEKWIADNTGLTPAGFDLEKLLFDSAVLKGEIKP